MRNFTSNLLKGFAALVALQSPLAAAAADRLYWVSETDGAIRAAHLDGSGGLFDLFGGEDAPCGVAIDSAAGKIYWANFNANGIRVANLDGSGAASTLFDDEGAVCGLAVDPAAGTIYWANFSTDEIRAANLDGSGAAVTLFQEPAGSAPSGVAIDPKSGAIYWTNQFSDEVRAGSLDGSGTATTLVSGEDNPLGVAIDAAAGKIYWAQLGTDDVPGSIRVANLDGTGASTLFGDVKPGGVAIDPGAHRIYWADFRAGRVQTGNLDGSGTAATLYDGDRSPLFPVLLEAPLFTEAPSISGGAKVGRALTCRPGRLAPDLLGAFLFRAPRSFAYQWMESGVAIPGAAGSTFTPSASGAYSCGVTASNEAGATFQTSATKKVKAGR
jgi:DNA-binding beta-propeller fold protein YncE